MTLRPHLPRTAASRAAALAAALLPFLLFSAGCRKREAEPAPEPAPETTIDPLAAATASIGKSVNLEASVPPMCYTKTGGQSNPCWVCHTRGQGPNALVDWDLQIEYAFSDAALTNHWSNLFVDRGAFLASVSDGEILRYVREDNYAPLREVLAGREGYPGYVPDLDLAAGFDDHGFARDGSGWRALRYHPFPGSFWPTNGSTGDVFIRLPRAFRSDAGGAPAREIYRINLAILEAAIAGDGQVREVEPVDERAAGMDLDRDGALRAGITRIVGLPAHYAGDAAGVPVHQGLYPQGVEMLHSVRYIDPDAPGLMARRMKELRYARKVQLLGDWGLLRAYGGEADDKEKGLVPVYRGSPLVGLLNDFGWQLQGFIEDQQGRLRLQTEEEHRFCMGCHSTIGVTVDQTFAFARKVPGAKGWRVQDLRGLKDRPQRGHEQPEILTYFRRVQGADELRANDEMLARFFPGGVLDEDAVRRAAVGGDQDLAWLLTPSRERALALNKAYLAIVREQSFTRGRDAVIAPARNVHRKIENGSTALERTGLVFRDGRLHLSWDTPAAAQPGAAAP